jgi:hypothetical protein
VIGVESAADVASKSLRVNSSQSDCEKSATTLEEMIKNIKSSVLLWKASWKKGRNSFYGK